ncbi:MAG: hypothetical protein VX334_05945, partial [Pseudomonadota bacterium]|nr:hypothetical protein [Pseudomonadota bacterium]
MLKYLTSAVLTTLLISACSEPKDVVITPEPQDLTEVTVGKWILDEKGNVMFDPQTSGLVVLDGQLVTIADASADTTQQLKLHSISPDTATLSASSERFSFSNTV